MPEHNLIEIAKHIGIAAVGGIAKYCNDYIKGVPFNWKLFLAKLVVCGFVGFLFSLVFSVYATEWKFVATAVGGYAGTEILDTSVYAIAKATGKKFLGVDIEIAKPEAPKPEIPKPKRRYSRRRKKITGAENKD